MIRPPRPCTYPGCGALTATGRCEKHPYIPRRDPEKLREYRRAYDQRRPESDRFYHNQPWAKLRAHVLNHSPLCVECERQGRLTPAKVVDHIQPLRERPDLAMDLANLRTLCASCHSRIGARVCNGNSTSQDFAE